MHSALDLPLATWLCRGRIIPRGLSATGRRKIFDTIEKGASNSTQQIILPVADTVGSVDDLVHGDLKGAAPQFGQAIVGGMTDVARLGLSLQTTLP